VSCSPETSIPHHEYIDRKKHNVIFAPICSCKISYPIGANFSVKVPTRHVTLHTKFEGNFSCHFRDTRIQSFVKISWCLFLLSWTILSSAVITDKFCTLQLLTCQHWHKTTSTDSLPIWSEVKWIHAKWVDSPDWGKLWCMSIWVE